MNYVSNRGDRPHYFVVNDRELVKTLTEIPGVARAAGGVRASSDAAWIVAAYLEVPPPSFAQTDDELRTWLLDLPGLARYRELGLHTKLRDYQKDGAVFLAARSYAMNCDPMRAGKSAQALSAKTLIGAQKTLIVCPAIAKYVWADECARWTNEEALLLEGRAGDEARRRCRVCDARGKVDGKRCDACKKKNGSADGYALYNQPDEVIAALDAASVVCVNYDVLVAQKVSDASGKIHGRADLPGWSPILGQFKFDVCIADEIHLIRGWSSNQDRRGQTRRERFCEVTDKIPIVWGLTGTPIFGFTRDLWGPLDAISKGAVTGSGYNNRLPFSFHARYCLGQKDSYGWTADGRSPLAETELVERLKHIIIQRPRSLILSSMPPKQRTVIRIDPKKGVPVRRAKKGESEIIARLSATLDQKLEALCENVVNECVQGNKCVVFTLIRKNAETVGEVMQREFQKHDVRTRLQNVQFWVVSGGTQPALRAQMAKTFREHTGPGVFVATIDSVQVAVSLRGAASVHFADLHWQPSAMLQAEDRPYELGVTGLSIVYYIVRGSMDEVVEQVVRPKIVTLDKIVHEKGAVDMKAALATAEDNKSMQEILNEMVEAADMTLGVYDED